MSKSIKKLSLKQGEDIEDFYFDSTTGVKGYDLYGTDEIVVGRWIDGKPIYRKYFNVDITLQANTWNSSIVNDFNGEQPVKAAAINDTAKHSYEGFDCQFYTDNKVYLKSPQSCNISDLFIWYTKTTDQPDSFEEESVELTSEHKTGRTFNGKPVYETVWLTKLPKNGTSSSAAMDIPSTTVDNLEYLIEATGSLRTDTGNIRALAFSSGSINNSIHYNNTAHCFTINNVGTIAAVDNQLIIKAQYTKITD